MQCPNCGFENIPGLPTCARCLSTLGSGDVVVVPPRASALRFRTRLLQAWYLLPRPTRGLMAAGEWLAERLIPERIPGRVVALNTLLPGLGYLAERSRRIGWLLLGSWCGLLVLALLTVASDWSMFFLATAVLVHSAAVIMPFASNLRFERAMMRLLFGGFVFLIFWYLVYGTVLSAAGNVVQPLQIVRITPGPVIQNGDGIVHEGRWLRPATLQRGDLVVFEIPDYGGAGYRVRRGVGLDRILGLPGEEIEVSDAGIMVNGKPLPPEYGPLGAFVPRILRRQLAANEYFIVPSRWDVHVVGQAQHFADEALQQLSVVPDSAIRGRVLWRTWPWSRFGPVE